MPSSLHVNCSDPKVRPHLPLLWLPPCRGLAPSSTSFSLCGSPPPSPLPPPSPFPFLFLPLLLPLIPPAVALSQHLPGPDPGSGNTPMLKSSHSGPTLNQALPSQPLPASRRKILGPNQLKELTYIHPKSVCHKPLFHLSVVRGSKPCKGGV